jgi:hypothetical protein
MRSAFAAAAAEVPGHARRELHGAALAALPALTRLVNDRKMSDIIAATT